MNDSRKIDEEIQEIREEAKKIINRRIEDTGELEEKMEINAKVQALVTELNYQISQESRDDVLNDKISIIRKELQELERWLKKKVE